MPATLATASTIVDVTLEFVAQLAYTALGLALLVQLQPETQVAVPVLLGLAVAGAAAAGFVLVQHRGLDYFDRLARMVGSAWIERGAAGAAALHLALSGIYRHRFGLWASFVLHLVCWIASAVEVWLALYLAGQPLSFGAVLAIESLLYAIRTAAFVVPQAVGVQEGAYILLGAGFRADPRHVAGVVAVEARPRPRDRLAGDPDLARARRPCSVAPARRRFPRPRAAGAAGRLIRNCAFAARSVGATSVTSEGIEDRGAAADTRTVSNRANRTDRRRPRAIAAVLTIVALWLRLAAPAPMPVLPDIGVAALLGEHALCLAAGPDRDGTPASRDRAPRQPADHADHADPGCLRLALRRRLHPARHRPLHV